MKPRFTLTLFLICFLLPGTIQAADPASQPAPELQSPLESAYRAWFSAMTRKDLAAWQTATATYRQMETRNRIISQRLRFPDALFAAPLQAPDISQLVLLNIFAKNNTATAIYFGKPNFGLGDSQTVSDNFIALKFIRESNIWKFDNLRIIKIGNDPDILLKIGSRDFSFLQNPTFQPTGIVPPIAKQVNPPFYLAELWIAANGFDVTVNVNNGNHKSRLTNDDGRDLIIGGLMRGENTISVQITPVPTASTLPKRLEVGIYATKAANQPANRVFHYAPDPAKAPPSYSVTLRVQ